MSSGKKQTKREMGGKKTKASVALFPCKKLNDNLPPPVKSADTSLHMVRMSCVFSPSSDRSIEDLRNLIYLWEVRHKQSYYHASLVTH